MIEKIGIVGLGLIGGSLARAVKSYDKNISVFAVDTSVDSLGSALKSGVINAGYTDINAALKEQNNSDIVIVATRAGRVAADINAVFVAAKDILITDVCSVKDFEVPAEAKYVGGHPMAGTEKSGYENSREDLFRGKKYIITEETPAAKKSGGKEKLQELVKILGAEPFELDKKTHDSVLARISHLPQIAAYVLAGCSAEEELNRVLAGSGFKDTTRIASSDPELWTEITRMNSENILTALDGYIDGLTVLRQKIAADDKEKITEIFKKGKEGRDGIC